MENKITYDLIQTTATEIAMQYRQANVVPELPGEDKLAKYGEILHTKFGKLAEVVGEQIRRNETWEGHGFEHLEYVSKMAAYLVESEGGDEEAVEMAVLAGLFHDIDRYLGFGEDHMVEGERSTKNILDKSEIPEKYKLVVVEVVRNHDHMDFRSENPNVDLVYGAVFDADHFRWGLEREDTFWSMKRKKGVTPEKVIHDYAFLPPLRDVWKTKYGQEVGPKLIDFGMAIAVGVEERLSKL